MRLILPMFPLVLLATACASTGYRAGNGPELVLRAAMDKAHYQPGEVAALALAAVPAQEEAVVSFRTSQRFDFAARADGEEVWRWSAEMMFLQVMGEETCRWDEPLLYTASWDLVGSDGEPLPPGEYEVWGELATHPPLRSPVVRIRIAEPEDG